MDPYHPHHDYLIITGPTASGKSALSLDLADRLGGVIINADSMQVYSDLSIMTARPSNADESQVPHKLYGIIDGSVRFSVGMWLKQLHIIVDEVRQAGRWPILVGGTGFYLQAARQGLSAIPDIPDSIRLQTRQNYAKIGGAESLAMLAKVDPDIANVLHAGDSQRVIRALEVHRHTGKPLSQWQKLPLSGGLLGRALCVVQMPPRDDIYAAIDKRFDKMMHDSALDEVSHLLSRKLPDDRPVMKALGVMALRDYLEGKSTLDQAIYLAKRDSRHYAKRQMTWIRNNFISNIVSDKQYSKSMSEIIFAKILEVS